jgi:hypothetical protein
MNRVALLPLVAALSVLQAEVTYASPLLDSLSVFASGAAVGGTQPDSVTAGNGSVWIEYGNGADSTGAGGSSTIVQYNAANGAIQHQYTISGLVDAAANRRGIANLQRSRNIFVLHARPRLCIVMCAPGKSRKNENQNAAPRDSFMRDAPS